MRSRAVLVDMDEGGEAPGDAIVLVVGAQEAGLDVDRHAAPSHVSGPPDDHDGRALGDTAAELQAVEAGTDQLVGAAVQDRPRGHEASLDDPLITPLSFCLEWYPKTKSRKNIRTFQ